MTRATSTIFFFVSFVWKLQKIKKWKVCQLNPVSPTTYETELLAVVYALSNFQIYIYGSKVILNTDNKDLSFLDRCAITSNTVARWSLEIQSHDLELSTWRE
jgi:hypothetical protein